MVAGDVFDSWEVRETGGTWMAWHPEYGWLQDRVDGSYTARYHTRAELLGHLTEVVRRPGVRP